MTILNINFEADSVDDITENLNYIAYQVKRGYYHGYNPDYIICPIDEYGFYNGCGIYNLSFEVEDDKDEIYIDNILYTIKHIANMIDSGYISGSNPYWSIDIEEEEVLKNDK
jgi:hypothetical protein